MLLLIIFVVVTVVCGLILRYGPWSWDSDLPGALLAIVAAISGVAAFICLCFLAGSKTSALERAERIKREEQYKTIKFILESDKIPGSDIIEQITDYNSMVLKRQANNKSIWLRAYTYDFWDQMPLIELKEG
jgi:hypothetical protein